MRAPDPPKPALLASSLRQGGTNTKQPKTNIRISRPRCARTCRAQRWPVFSHSLLCAPRSAAWGGLGLALFERSELARPRPKRAPQVARSDSCGTLTVGSPFFCLLFFGEAKKSECAVGRTSRHVTAPGRESKAPHAGQAKNQIKPPNHKRNQDTLR